MLDSTNAAALDGRLARSHRTRAAIAEALVELLDEGNPQPTIDEIALRASVAPRTVFQHYADRETLFAVVSTSRAAQLEVLTGQIDLSAPLDVRIDEVVAQRLRVYEFISGVRRGALLMEPFSEAVHEALEGFRTSKRAELRRVFATEITALPEGEGATLTAALGAAAAWSTWEALRTHQQLDPEAAAATLRFTLRALLAAG
jgi:TetR/AcrR family transcriptional regulator of autoinduction and epiphytic fitness